MVAKIQGDAVQRALELAGVQFIVADGSGGEGRAPAPALKGARVGRTAPPSDL
jgi:hypothetical protein